MSGDSLEAHFFVQGNGSVIPFDDFQFQLGKIPLLSKGDQLTEHGGTDAQIPEFPDQSDADGAAVPVSDFGFPG